jgi:large subunit ribosomal protein L24
MKIHTGDTVVIISGKDKGKTGTVLRVLSERQHVIVQGANLRTRHIKKTAQSAGQRIRYEASLHVSKVMLLDPKTKKPTRVGYKVDAKTGKKERIAKVSGTVIEGVAKTAPAKGASKAKTKKKEDDAQTEAPDTVAAPKKSPFWKRMGMSSAAETPEVAGGTAAKADDTEKRHTPIVQRSGRGK